VTTRTGGAGDQDDLSRLGADRVDGGERGRAGQWDCRGSGEVQPAGLAVTAAVGSSAYSLSVPGRTG
jgi:hypothetical protein